MCMIWTETKKCKYVISFILDNKYIHYLSYPLSVAINLRPTGSDHHEAIANDL